MEEKILKEIFERINRGEKAGLVTVTETSGSTPRKTGTIMGIFKDSIIGTIGGGNIEYKLINLTREMLDTDEICKEFSYNLTTDDELRMNCGGNMKGVVKIFSPSPKLLICGAGHIGQKIFNISKNLSFTTKIIDDREELKKDCPELTLGDFEDVLKNEVITGETYIVIATRGHLLDEKVLNLVKDRGAKYIGIIGSKRKITALKENLGEWSDNIYAPIGLKISDGTPEEIAIEILAEILKIKNNGELVHRSIMNL